MVMTFAAPPWSPGEPPQSRIAGGILAGGASRRMGGRPKALLPWPPGAPAGTFLDAILTTYAACDVAPVAIVTGAHHDAIAEGIGPRPAPALVFNPDHAAGQITSLWRLLDWADTLPGDVAWLAVALVDTPAFLPQTLARLCETARGNGGSALVVRPAFGSRHGHPVLWHRHAWPRLRQAALETGARPTVHALVAEGRVRDVHVDDPGVVRDIDTPEDYAAAARADGPPA